MGVKERREQSVRKGRVEETGQGWLRGEKRGEERDERSGRCIEKR